jgi:copper chaperone
MKVKLEIKGMHCKSCEALLKDAFEEIGVKSSKINSSTGIAIVEFDEKKVSLAALKKAVVDEGYTVVKVE